MGTYSSLNTQLGRKPTKLELHYLNWLNGDYSLYMTYLQYSDIEKYGNLPSISYIKQLESDGTWDADNYINEQKGMGNWMQSASDSPVPQTLTKIGVSDLSEKMAKTNLNNVLMPMINSKSISNPASADVLGISAQTINSYAPFQSPQQLLGWAYDPNSNYTKLFNLNVSEVKNQPIPTPSQVLLNLNLPSQPNQNPFTGNFDLTNPQNYINSIILPTFGLKLQQPGLYEQWAKNQINSLQNFQPSNEYGSNLHQRIMNGTTLPFGKPNIAPNDPSLMKLTVNMPTKEDMLAEIEKKISSSNIDSKISFGDKFEHMVDSGMMDGKLNTGIAIALGVSNIISLFTGPRDEFSGKEGNLAKTMDSTYDKATELAGKFGPWGKVVLAGMIANKAVSNIVGKLGGSTDGMTKADSILGSPFFQMTPLGIINGFGGKKADSFTKDTELFSQIGGSYGGSSELTDAVGTVLDKKYGLFSSGARGEANRAIAEAKRQQTEISKINTEALNRKNLQGSMASINSTAYDMLLQGGYDQASIRVGRYGMVLRAKQILSALKFKKGGNILKQTKPSFEEWISSIPVEFLRPDYDYLMAYKVLPLNTLINHAKDPINNQLNSVSGHADEKGRIPFLKLGDIYQNPEIIFEINKYNSDNELGKALRSKYDLSFLGDRYYYIPKNEQKELFQPSEIITITPTFKSGGSLDNTEVIYSISPKIKIQEFKEGGAFNVIPEGALHAHKHNMENADNLTKKGIPVVTENENGELEQLAEIEKEEIILRLSVTKRLEELAKENTEESAIEAGKLLVQEILYNTIDHTKKLI